MANDPGAVVNDVGSCATNCVALTNVVVSWLLAAPTRNTALSSEPKFCPVMVIRVHEPTGAEFWLRLWITGGDTTVSTSCNEMEFPHASKICMRNENVPAVVGVPFKFVFVWLLGPGW